MSFKYILNQYIRRLKFINSEFGVCLASIFVRQLKNTETGKLREFSGDDFKRFICRVKLNSDSAWNEQVNLLMEPAIDLVWKRVSMMIGYSYHLRMKQKISHN